MKRLLVIGILFFANLSYAQIRIYEPTKSFGDIFETGGIVKTTFNLFNPYLEDTIRIVNINTSCGCTAILTEERVINPRQTLELVVAYNPKDRPGLFVKSIEVETITGKNERNALYLKVSGNVIAENKEVNDKRNELLEYRVAPISYFAVTSFDTSYLDFSFFISFINDISFEVDYFQFANVGIDVEVSDDSHIPDLENLLQYTRTRIKRGFIERGYDPNTVIFDEPRFIIGDVPIWSTARIKVYSYYFNDTIINESVVRVQEDELVEDEKLLLNFSSTDFPVLKKVLDELRYKAVESKLFLNNSLHLRGVVGVPHNFPLEKTKKFQEDLKIKLFKKLKSTTGITEEAVIIDVDSIKVRTDSLYNVQIWDKSDEESQTQIQFVMKSDKITPPQLPTYKQSTVVQQTVDMASNDFRRFWRNLVLNHKGGNKIKLLIESSTSHKPLKDETIEKHMVARNNGNGAVEYLKNKFRKETGAELDVELITAVHGPPYTKEYRKYVDYDSYEYMTFIPLVHHKPYKKEAAPKPYQVNFDYFFNGVDTTSLVFRSFAKYIRKTVERDGYVSLRIESSISRIPIERNKSNLYLAHSRSFESQKRIKEHLKRLLVDENRIIFTEERNLIQGPEYKPNMTILSFRKYQYLRIVPDKLLKSQ